VGGRRRVSVDGGAVVALFARSRGRRRAELAADLLDGMGQASARSSRCTSVHALPPVEVEWEAAKATATSGSTGWIFADAATSRMSRHGFVAGAGSRRCTDSGARAAATASPAA